MNNFLFFNVDDWTFTAYALAIHALSFLFVLGVLGSVRPDLLTRKRRLKLFLALLPFAAVLGGLAQVYAVTQLYQSYGTAQFRKLNPPYVFANHHRLVFFAVPYGVHVLALVVGMYLHGRRPSRALADDFSDSDPFRHRDATPPGIRRLVPPLSASPSLSTGATDASAATTNPTTGPPPNDQV